MDRVSLAKADKPITFFSSGSTLLDLALGGGWALGRVFNIVGDKSTGKTLLAIEGFANFKLKFPKGRMRYAEAESAFDTVFAEQLGFPSDVERPDDMLHTVEEFIVDLHKFIDAGEGPCLYVLDSLDALSDEAEVKKFDKGIKQKIQDEETGEETKQKGSYGVAKAKKMSEMFRLLCQDIGEVDCSLGIISQIRDKIGVMFGETKTRSGGHALDFYGSQVLWLSETGKIERTAMGQKRVTGVDIHSKVKKNKVAFPFREADYSIIFGYGIDDEVSILDWMKEIKAIPPETYKQNKDKLERLREKREYTEIKTLRESLVADSTNLWKEIEKRLMPPIRKYGN
jgi:recombination protein RecA